MTAWVTIRSERSAVALRSHPMAYVDRVATPTMVIHSEADRRTLLEQGQRWQVALRRNGVPAELLIFPAKGTGCPARAGRPTAGTGAPPA